MDRLLPSSPASSTASQSKRKFDYIRPSSDTWPSSTTKKERVLSSATRIYIIPDKLTEDEIDDLRDMITSMGGMNSSLAYANLILTTLRAEKRIYRQLVKEVLVSGNLRLEEVSITLISSCDSFGRIAE